LHCAGIEPKSAGTKLALKLTEPQGHYIPLKLILDIPTFGPSGPRLPKSGRLSLLATSQACLPTTTTPSITAADNDSPPPLPLTTTTRITTQVSSTRPPPFVARSLTTTTDRTRLPRHPMLTSEQQQIEPKPGEYPPLVAR